MHLLDDEIGAALALQVAAELLLGNLVVRGRLAALREHLLEAVNDLLARHIRRGGEHVLPEHLGLVQHGRLDVLARVAGVVHGEHGLGRDRQPEGPVVVGGRGPEHAAR